MSTSSGLSLRIVPERSRLYLALIGVTHTLALFGVSINALPYWIKGLLFLTVMVSYFWSLTNYLNNGFGQSVISYNEWDGWGLQRIEEEWNSVKLLGSSIRTQHLSILHFRTESGQFQAVLVFKDSLDAESYRQLQVVLRVVGSG